MQLRDTFEAQDKQMKLDLDSDQNDLVEVKQVIGISHTGFSTVVVSVVCAHVL